MIDSYITEASYDDNTSVKIFAHLQPRRVSVVYEALPDEMWVETVQHVFHLKTL